MACPLLNWCHVRHCLCCISKQQLASASNADSRNPLRSRHGLGAFFIMQPSFGLGFAASKMSNPTQARPRSLMNHTAFGIGLYLFGLLVSWFIRQVAQAIRSNIKKARILCRHVMTLEFPSITLQNLHWSVYMLQGDTCLTKMRRSLKIRMRYGRVDFYMPEENVITGLA